MEEKKYKQINPFVIGGIILAVSRDAVLSLIFL